MNYEFPLSKFKFVVECINVRCHCITSPPPAHPPVSSLTLPGKVSRVKRERRRATRIRGHGDEYFSRVAQVHRVLRENQPYCWLMQPTPIQDSNYGRSSIRRELTIVKDRVVTRFSENVREILLKLQSRIYEIYDLINKYELKLSNVRKQPRWHDVIIQLWYIIIQ